MTPAKVTADILRTWTGTDAELARHLDVTPQAVSLARARFEVPRTVNGRTMRKRGLSRAVCRAIVTEANRRGTTVAEVLLDLGVWADGAEGPEIT